MGVPSSRVATPVTTPGHSPPSGVDPPPSGVDPPPSGVNPPPSGVDPPPSSALAASAPGGPSLRGPSEDVGAPSGIPESSSPPDGPIAAEAQPNAPSINPHKKRARTIQVIGPTRKIPPAAVH